MFQICIIGGGACGIAAALAALSKDEDISLAIVEKNSDLGKKILATGNGRCNVTNENAPEHQRVLDFFRGLGIYLKKDEQGRYWPGSNRAEDILFGMISRLKNYNIKYYVNITARSVKKIGDCFHVGMDDGSTIKAGKVLIATGGKAGPQYGTTGDGYRIARENGHNVTRIYPILAPLESEDVHGLAGSRAGCSVTLWDSGVVLEQERGEVQFTKDGLSGICIFDLSRRIVLEGGKTFGDYRLELDLVPDLDESGIVDIMKKSSGTLRDGARSFVTAQIAGHIAERLSIDGEKAIADADDGELASIAGALKSLVFRVSGVKGYRQAQCTGGGVALDEIREDTGESKLVSGLYFGGEILDHGEKCGGYNLNFAFLSGLKAGEDMAGALK